MKQKKSSNITLSDFELVESIESCSWSPRNKPSGLKVIEPLITDHLTSHLKAFFEEPNFKLQEVSTWLLLQRDFFKSFFLSRTKHGTTLSADLWTTSSCPNAVAQKLNKGSCTRAWQGQLYKCLTTDKPGFCPDQSWNDVILNETICIKDGILAWADSIVCSIFCCEWDTTKHSHRVTFGLRVLLKLLRVWFTAG